MPPKETKKGSANYSSGARTPAGGRDAVNKGARAPHPPGPSKPPKR